MMSKRILILHGPNLNLLGTRQPEVYGSMTLDEINRAIQQYVSPFEVESRAEQSNHEGELIDHLHRGERLGGRSGLQSGRLYAYINRIARRHHGGRPACDRSPSFKYSWARAISPQVAIVGGMPGPNRRLWLAQLYPGSACLAAQMANLGQLTGEIK